MSKLKIAVFFGGVSTEHEVSRWSAVHVIKSMDSKKFEAVLFEIAKDGSLWEYKNPGEFTDEFCNELVLGKNVLARTSVVFDSRMFKDRGIDVVFPVLHGTGGEDGVLQGFLDLCDIPYVGSGVAGSAVSFDKVFTKEILSLKGIRQARYRVLNTWSDKENIFDDVEVNLGWPVFVKPANGGSSVGIYKAKDRKELAAAVAKAALYDRKVIIEEAIDGMELECAVVGGYEQVKALGVGRIIPCNEFYDYNAKYIDDDSEVIVPAGIDDAIAGEIMDMAVKSFKAVDAYGLARVDFFLSRNGDIYLNEINTMPGFTRISMYPKLWRYAGGTDTELVDLLVDMAIERHKKYRFLKEYKPDEE